MNAVTRQKIGSCQLHTDLQVSFLFQKKKWYTIFIALCSYCFALECAPMWKRLKLEESLTPYTARPSGKGRRR